MRPTGDRVYLLKAGRVRVMRNDVVVSVLGSGQMFGTSSLFGAAATGQRVVAVDDVVICDAPAGQFLVAMGATRSWPSAPWRSWRARSSSSQRGETTLDLLARGLPDRLLGSGSGASWRSVECDAAIGSPADASDELRVSSSGWTTDFAKRCVPLSEILSGGPPRDGIPPIDEPGFITVGAAERWLAPREPVITIVEGADARAYPLQILLWHEIVNDEVGGQPLVITFCPLCNTALVFERRVAGTELTFGTTGLLRRSDLVMWDRQSQSWWQQATGEAIVGHHTGTRLARRTSLVLSFEEFRRAYPDGRVLSRDAANEEARRKTGTGRDYGRNPYTGYDLADSGPASAFWLGPQIGGRLPPKTRVAVARSARPPVAYPLDGLRGAVAFNDLVAGRPVALLFLGGVASPLDRGATKDGADIGQAALYARTVRGRSLTFAAGGGRTFRDHETGTEWSVTGRAVSGPLAGEQLDHEVTFWFIWAVFRPDTEIRRPAP